MSLPQNQTTLVSADPKAGTSTRLRGVLRSAVLALLIAGVVAALLFHPGRLGSFDLHTLAAQLRAVSLRHVVLGLLLIYTAFCLRALRWSVLLGSNFTGRWTQLIPSQFIGFTAVAIFGRVADLSRPYLTARQLETPVATQLAVYSIERTFDLAAAAILFSATLVFAPSSLQHHEAFARAGLLSLAGTVLLAVLALTIRFSGDRLVPVLFRSPRHASSALARQAATRMREFQDGFGTITSIPQFLSTLGLSLVMWLEIALTYLEAARAFLASPVLANIDFARIMLLMATSLGASLLQLPVVGWFTQIAVIAAAYHAFFNVPLETGSACGALTLALTSLSVIPGGVVAARLKRISLRQAQTDPRA